MILVRISINYLNYTAVLINFLLIDSLLHVHHSWYSSLVLEHFARVGLETRLRMSLKLRESPGLNLFTGDLQHQLNYPGSGYCGLGQYVS